MPFKFQYLEPCGFPPAPQVPIIAALHLVKSAMENEFGEGYSLCHELPPGCSYADVGK